MLTEKQRTLLVFIHDCLNERGVSPSFDEMKDALGLKSKSGIHRLITALEERGQKIQPRSQLSTLQKQLEEVCAKDPAWTAALSVSNTA